jgi:hypothetical protein
MSGNTKWTLGGIFAAFANSINTLEDNGDVKFIHDAMNKIAKNWKMND